MTYGNLLDLKYSGKLKEEELDLFNEIEEEIEACYYGSEIKDLYGEKASIEDFRGLLGTYSDVDFGSNLGTRGILDCEADSTGYTYSLVSCSGVDTSHLQCVYGLMHSYTSSFILWMIINKLLNTQINVIGALTIAHRHLKEIGLEELIHNITQPSYKEGLFELDIIELLHRVNSKKLNEICNNISSQYITDADKMVTMFKEEIKFTSLGKNLGTKLDLIGVDTSEIVEKALTNVLYLILNEKTYDIDIVDFSSIPNENEKRVCVDITYGTETASTRPIDSEEKYKEAYEEYGSTHKEQLDSLTGMELCRLCMIAKYTTYSAKEAFDLASLDDNYNKFMRELYSGK